jgi:hypothetical protein
MRTIKDIALLVCSTQFSGTTKSPHPYCYGDLEDTTIAERAQRKGVSPGWISLEPISLERLSLERTSLERIGIEGISIEGISIEGISLE